jgi:PAS domain S-box-containing protein
VFWEFGTTFGVALEPETHSFSPSVVPKIPSVRGQESEVGSDATDLYNTLLYPGLLPKAQFRRLRAILRYNYQTYAVQDLICQGRDLKKCGSLPSIGESEVTCSRSIKMRGPLPQSTDPRQTLFENFFESSPDAIVVTNENGRITNVNSQVEKVFGYTRAELLGFPVETLMPERFRAAHPSHRGTYSGHPSVRPMGTGSELYGRRKDGSEFPVDIMLSPVETPEGPIFLSVVRDISEKNWTEEKVRQSEGQLQELIDAIPQQVFVFDPDWRPLFANRRELEYTGLTLREARSKDAVAKIFHPEDFKRLEVMRERMRSEGTPFEMEARIRGKDGHYRWFLIRDNPLRDEQGHVLRWYGTRTDIEDRKRAEEAWNKAQADLARVTRVMTMGELAASIAHEVNQPIAGVVMNASSCLRWLAADPPDIEEARLAARRIIRDGERAGNVITRIRALATKTDNAKERLDMSETIRAVIALVRDELYRNRVRLRTEFVEDLSPVLGDRVQLQQVVLNLVINAIESMSEVADRPRELIISTENDEGGQVRVTVRDSGIGLDPRSIEQMFETFYTTKVGGMGMGLSICRSIIQSHEGQLWAVANDGAGATFQFTVPKNR